MRRFAINNLADALTAGTSVYASDDDPELIEAALPFALKTLESLLAEVPEHRGLLLGSCQGYVQYTYGFVALDLQRLELDDYRRYQHQRQRALKLYRRARDYCLRGLDIAVPGTREALMRIPEQALADFGEDDVELLLWSATAWGAAISIGLDQPELVVDTPAVRALVERALELDPDFGLGAVQEMMMVLEGLPETLGGDVERARRHYERALELNGGRRPSTYVGWAEGVSIRRQDREEFERLLGKALEIDPDALPDERLATLIYQDRARILLALADDLFL